ncbi:MAG: rod shape-determining protein RodA, partial [Gammaproteobacteria bacterium]
PRLFKQWSLGLYLGTVALLILVLWIGDIGKGAQRWLVVAGIRFQPSELMKLAMPLMLAWFLDQKPLPPDRQRLVLSFLLIFVPTLLIALQPDLGTSVLIAMTGLFVIFLAGISWRLIATLIGAIIVYAPIHWVYFMHDYQRRRVLTFLNPESDPLNSGYHIIQSKIAIGSGGLVGKGWLNGTQSQLDFLPERHTDFIFSVMAEEFGFLGVAALLVLYCFVVARALYLAVQAQDSFSRLTMGALALTLFVYVFVNVGMVSGMLPVVGLPLPLISYGGTSMVTLLASMGVIMSMHTHRRITSEL